MASDEKEMCLVLIFGAHLVRWVVCEGEVALSFDVALGWTRRRTVVRMGPAGRLATALTGSAAGRQGTNTVQSTSAFPLR